MERRRPFREWREAPGSPFGRHGWMARSFRWTEPLSYIVLPVACVLAGLVLRWIILHFADWIR